MQIGIGLPGMIPGTTGEQVVEWARRADAGPFSSLASLDRLVYRNYESLIMLAAAAAVTQRVRLMTTVLIAPLHNPAIFAKQAASIDALSHGRLTLGLGVGAREDDYRAAGVDFHTFDAGDARLDRKVVLAGAQQPVVRLGASRAAPCCSDARWSRGRTRGEGAGAPA